MSFVFKYDFFTIVFWEAFLLDTSFFFVNCVVCKYFSQFVAFHSLNKVFWEQKFLVLMKFILSAIRFMDRAFVVKYKNCLADPDPEDFLLWVFFLYKFYRFTFYIEVCDALCINLCIKFEV